MGLRTGLVSDWLLQVLADQLTRKGKRYCGQDTLGCVMPAPGALSPSIKHLYRGEGSVLGITSRAN